MLTGWLCRAAGGVPGQRACTAVRSCVNGGSLLTFAERWNATRWPSSPPPPVTTSHNQLYAAQRRVSAPDHKGPSAVLCSATRGCATGTVEPSHRRRSQVDQRRANHIHNRIICAPQPAR
jgi:hypothetical protein